MRLDFAEPHDVSRISVSGNEEFSLANHFQPIS